MKIVLAQYQQNSPVEVQAEYNPKRLDVEFVDWKYLGGIKLEGSIEKEEETLRFAGHLVSDVEKLCGRCLTPVREHVDQTFQLLYPTQGVDQIDATDDLREVLILKHPLNFLCREDCRGLCPRCGINLNEETCRCTKAEGGEEKKSLSKLKDVWNQLKEEKKNG